MKTILIFVLAALWLSGTSSSSFAGRIDLFSSSEGWDGGCGLSGQAGEVTVYVFHEQLNNTAPGAGSRFRLETGGGFDGVFIGSWGPTFPDFFFVVGDAESGVEIYYPHAVYFELVLIATYLSEGLSPPCSYVTVAPHPDAITGEIEYLSTRSGEWVEALGTTIYVDTLHGPCDRWCETGGGVPVEPTTWGRVKALYE